ncbi:galactosylceramide sulfotransferase-like [Glandiceps talaboti]
MCMARKFTVIQESCRDETKCKLFAAGQSDDYRSMPNKIVIVKVLVILALIGIPMFWLSSLPYAQQSNQVFLKKILGNLRGNVAHQPTNMVTSHLKLPCKPQRDFVFIKTVKTGGSTMATLLFRYGLKHDLVAAVDKGSSIQISINETSNTVMIHPYNCENFPGYNFIANHMNYRRVALDKIIKNGKYFTILRSPIRRIESAFYMYYEHRGLEFHQFSNPFLAYLQMFTSKNDTIVRTLRPLGFNENFKRLIGIPKIINDTFVYNSIRNLDSELDLVMLSEYYDESLVLLRKMMCWEYEDMVYRRQRVRKEVRLSITPDMENVIKEHSPLDIALYAYFNKTFWEKVKRYEGDFEEDLAKLRSFQNEVDLQCQEQQEPLSDYCAMLAKGVMQNTRIVIEKQRKWDC